MSQTSIAADSRKLGRFHVKREEYEQALRYYTVSVAAYRHHEDAVLALVSRGIVLRKLGRFEEALSCFNAALQDDPANTKALWNRALTYRELSQFGAAARELQSFQRGGLPGIKKQSIERELQKTKDMLKEHVATSQAPPNENNPTKEGEEADSPLQPAARTNRSMEDDTVDSERPSNARGSNVVPVHFSQKASSSQDHGSPPVAPTIAAAQATAQAAVVDDDEKSSTRLAGLPSPDRQQHMIRQSMEQWERRGLHQGDFYFIVEASWWRLWCHATGYRGPGAPEEELQPPTPSIGGSGNGGEEGDNSGESDVHVMGRNGVAREGLLDSLGPIPNSLLVDDTVRGTESPRLREGLSAGTDLVLVPPEAWQALKAWFGADAELQREVINLAAEEEKDAAAEKGEDWSGLQDPAAEKIGEVDPANLIVDLYPELREEERQRIRRSFLAGQTISASGPGVPNIGVTGKEGWPHGDVFDDPPRSFARRGLVGCENLGNTCYMNSAVQCVSAAWPLTAYFLAGRDKEEMNTDNPLGTGGRLVAEFAHLVRLMWLQDRRYRGGIMATGLKRAVGHFRREFQGFAQHDSHELLSFLLDGIHEDLNRIQDKQFVENAEAGNRPDVDVAKEAWIKYQERNRSVIVDHISGLLKSTLVCPECGNVSRSFDPYSSISLPLPPPRITVVQGTFFHAPRHWGDDSNVTLVEHRTKARYDHLYRYVPPQVVEIPSRRRKVGVAMDRQEPVRVLRKKLAEELAMEPHRIILGVYMEGTIGRVLEDDQIVGQVYRKGKTVLGIYEVPEPPRDAPDPFDCRLPPSASPVEGDNDDVAKEEGEDDIASSKQKEAELKLDEHGALSSTEEMEDLIHVFLPLMWPDRYAPGQFKFRGLPMSVSVPRKATARNFRRRVLEHIRLALPLEDDEDPERVAEGLPLQVCVPKGQQCGEVGPVPWDDTTVEEVFQPIGNTAMCGFQLVDGVDERFDTTIYDTNAPSSSVAEAARQVKAQPLSLWDCIEEFTHPEVLDERNTWFCSECKQHVCATKSMQVWSLPDILILQFKRFQNGGVFFARKLDLAVDYPRTGLDLSSVNLSYLDSLGRDTRAQMEVPEGANGGDGAGEQPAADDDVPPDVNSVYDLFGVVNHFGDLGFGHYTAFCNRYVGRYGIGPESGGGGHEVYRGTEKEADCEWFEFDDTTVRNAPPEAVVHGDAYLLFYRRRGARMP